MRGFREEQLAEEQRSEAEHTAKHTKRSEPLGANGIERENRGVRGFWQVSFFDEVDSTNTRIKEAIVQGYPEGTCFVARKQTAAYGRQGRSWSSPEGGLYFSFILDPLHAHSNTAITQKELPSLSLVLSLGIQTALSAYVDSDAIKIKWPNDVLVVSEQGYAKLCGISLEMLQGKLCCGVGINVFRSSSSALKEGQPDTPVRYEQAYLAELLSASQQRATSEHAFEETIELLLPALLSSIEAVYTQWLEQGIEPLILLYDELLYNRGEHVFLETIDGKPVCEGEVVGVAATGELLLRNKEGVLVSANSGEVHTRL